MAFLKKQLRMLFMVIPVKRFLLRMWSNYIPDTILMRHRRHYPDVLKETEVLCCPYIIVVIPIHCSSIWKVEACRQNTGNWKENMKRRSQFLRKHRRKSVANFWDGQQIAVVHKYTSRQEKRIIYQIMIRFCMRYGNRIVIRLSICWTIIPMKLL